MTLSNLVVTQICGGLLAVTTWATGMEPDR